MLELALLSALIAFALTAAGGVILTTTFRRRLERTSTSLQRRMAEYETEFKVRMEALQKRIDELEEEVSRRSQPSSQVLAPRVRSQAIQRLRRGESTGTVAQGLSIPLPEVELLAKVYRLIVSHAD